MVYKTLFNIDLLHAYFLDRGAKKYHATNPADELSTEEKEDAAQNYNLRDFMQVVPNQKTKAITKNYKLLVRHHKKGIRVLASALKVNTQEGLDTVERYSPIIELSDDLVLTFFIKATDAYFGNYTDIIGKKENQLYYFSNSTSTVSNIFDATSSIETWDNFLISAKETRRLLYELEKESEFVSHAPKRVSIANITTDAIDAMEAKVTAETALEEEEQEILDDLNQAVTVLKNSKVIGVIQLKMSGDESTEFTETLNTEDVSTGLFDIPKQCLFEEAIDFKLYVENKKSFWRYHQKSESEIMVTDNEKPLTKNGRVEIGKTDVTPEPSETFFFPNPTVESITKESDDFYSEIFI